MAQGAPEPSRTLDLERTREVFEASQDFTIGLEEEFALVDPDSLELRPPLRGALRGLSGGRPARRVGGRRADRHRDRDSLRPGGELRRGDGASARSAATDCSRSPTGSGLALAATGTHPWASYLDQQIIDTAALQPPARGAALGRAAQQHLEPARARRHPAAPIGRSPSATTCASVLPPLLALSANSPFLDGHDTGLASVRTEIFTRTFPRCGVHEPFGDWAAYARFIDLLSGHRIDRRGDAAVVERPPASPVRDRRAADLRRADARRGVVRARGHDHRLHRAGGARLRRRPARRAPAPAGDRGEPLAGDSPRPRRDPDRLRGGRGDSHPCGAGAADRVDGARPRGARPGVSSCRSTTALSGCRRSLEAGCRWSTSTARPSGRRERTYAPG